MKLHEKAKRVENASRELANMIWLRITGMWDDAPLSVQQLSAIYLARELCQHAIHGHHLGTEDPDAKESAGCSEETPAQEERPTFKDQVGPSQDPEGSEPCDLLDEEKNDIR